jgi:hypothetical protein
MIDYMGGMEFENFVHLTYRLLFRMGRCPHLTRKFLSLGVKLPVCRLVHLIYTSADRWCQRNEIRDFDQIAKGENLRLTSEEIELGRGLIEKLSSEGFEPESLRG